MFLFYIFSLYLYKKLVEHCIDDEPCLNNGECNPTEDGTGYKCTCLPKFYGDRCENGKYTKCFQKLRQLIFKQF